MSFIFLRHSKRRKEDLSMEKSLNRTGQYHSNACLKDKLKKLNINEIYCSPFLRCLQTVDQFSKENNIPIKIEASLAEKYSDEDLTTLQYETLDQEDYLNMINNFNIDKDYIPIYSVNNLLEQKYNVFNDTFKERIELFLDFLDNCKQDNQNILIVSHSSTLNELISTLYNENVSLKMGEFLTKKLNIEKKKRKMSLRKSFVL